MMKKRGWLITLGVVGVCILCVIAGLLALGWWRSWHPFIDDGPFHGKPRASIPARQPDQRFALYNRFTIEVYDAAANEPAPTVVLKDQDSSIKWAIYAIADDMRNTTVRSIRFKDWRHFPFKEPRAFAIVNWTFGREASWWFISREGELKEYWYSW
jgi:hypothetical protein